MKRSPLLRSAPLRRQSPRRAGQLPKGFPVRRRGSCVPAAYLILSAIGRGEAVSGYVDTIDYAYQHTWVEVDGEVIDPTVRQFPWWRASKPAERIERYRVPHTEFLSSFEACYALPWTDGGFHYRKFEQWVAPVIERRSLLASGRNQ